MLYVSIILVIFNWIINCMDCKHEIHNLKQLLKLLCTTKIFPLTSGNSQIANMRGFFCTKLYYFNNGRKEKDSCIIFAGKLACRASFLGGQPGSSLIGWPVIWLACGWQLVGPPGVVGWIVSQIITLLCITLSVYWMSLEFQNF